MAEGARRVAVVMAGGWGERFWPLSRQARPKQLLHLTSERETMLGEAVSRLAPLIPPEDIHVVTGAALLESIREGHVGVPAENVLAEPCKRSTTGCLAYATAYLLVKYSAADARLESKDVQSRLSMAVVTADPLIRDGDAFRRTLKTAMDAAESERALATIGVVPTRPETGYGYIQIPEDRRPLSCSTDGVEVYPVTRFHEKPNRETAEEFLSTGRYFWNAGMFFWNIAVFMSELHAVRPDLVQSILAMADAMRAHDDARVAAIFEGIENIAIDYALMERAQRVVMARADFAWDDIGAWPALERAYPHDAQGNVLVGDPVAIDCRDCIVYNDTGRAGPERAVAVVGAEDLVVVATDDAVLVIPKDRAQEVRHVLAELHRRRAKQV